jgi:hypothetical protein
MTPEAGATVSPNIASVGESRGYRWGSLGKDARVGDLRMRSRYVELVDGSGVDRRLKIDGATALRTGDILPRRLYNRMWRINRVDPTTMRGPRRAARLTTRLHPALHHFNSRAGPSI